MKAFKEKIRDLFDDYEKLVTRKNIPVEGGNGIFTRYQYPVLTAAHTPVFWRYDLDEKTNPFLMERIGMNATLNSGAIKWNVNICWWCVLKERIVNLSSQWLKVLTA